MTQIHRTVFQVEVFSEGPLDLSRRDDDPFEINEGSCVGNVEEVESTVVPPEQIEANLTRIGNDGEFFKNGSNAIEDALVGYPDGWYVFDAHGDRMSGPHETEEDAEADRLDPTADWVGQYDGGYLDLSYAPDNLP
jgi:hypothetical protein